MRTGVARGRGERGSALLIVLVFSAVILIMLYREIPIAMFEAQRQKEQLAVDRGHEYQRGVQLYYRKFRGQYPASIDQLMNTNGVRFLRRKYKDPLTGKDDWRILHAGPGGILTDSKVTPISTMTGGGGANDPNSFFAGKGSAAGSQTTAAGGLSTTASLEPAQASSTDLASLDGQDVKRRSAPAIAANGQGTGAPADASGSGLPNTPTTAQLDADPSKPLLPSTADAAVNPASTNPPPTPGTGTAAAASAASTPNGQASMNAVTGNNQNQNNLRTGGGNGLAGAGGIAGVASMAKGRSVKKVNEQDDYSLWEFYYDPKKDTGAGTGGTQANNPVMNQGGVQPGQTNGNGASSSSPNSGFSSNNGSSSPGVAVPQPTGPSQ